jgi:hypothetical protein
MNEARGPYSLGKSNYSRMPILEHEITVGMTTNNNMNHLYCTFTGHSIEVTCAMPILQDCSCKTTCHMSRIIQQASPISAANAGLILAMLLSGQALHTSVTLLQYTPGCPSLQVFQCQPAASVCLQHACPTRPHCCSIPLHVPSTGVSPEKSMVASHASPASHTWLLKYILLLLTAYCACGQHGCPFCPHRFNPGTHMAPGNVTDML